MTTLCTAQKQTNLTTSLLQDIPFFHEHDATWLEDWLMDIEMAADLSNDSRANLAKAKSRGLTHTLIIEAITLDKLWEDIKDFLRLKFAMLISTPIYHASWKFSIEKMNLSQHTFTTSKQRQGDVILPATLPP